MRQALCLLLVLLLLAPAAFAAISYRIVPKVIVPLPVINPNLEEETRDTPPAEEPAERQPVLPRVVSPLPLPNVKPDTRYNERGQETASKELEWAKGIGINAENIRNIQYNKQGRIISFEYTDEEGETHAVKNISYDEFGRVVGYKEVTKDSDSPELTETTVKNMEYNSFGQLVGYTEVTHDSSSPEKTTTTTHALEYNSLGQVEKETMTDLETGKRTDAGALKDTLKGLKDAKDLRKVPGLESRLPPGLLDTGTIACPEVPADYAIPWPLEPYDFEKGDCEMIGKESAVDDYIAALKVILLDCRDKADDKYAQFLEEKQKLLDTIEALPVVEEVPSLLMEELEPGEPSDLDDLGDMEGSIGELDDCPHYTETYMLNMKDAVKQTCKGLDGLNKVFGRLRKRCEKINEWLNANPGATQVKKDEWLNLVNGIYHIEEYYKNGVQVTVDWFQNTLEPNYHAYYNATYAAECCDKGPMVSSYGDLLSTKIRNLGAPARVRLREQLNALAGENARVEDVEVTGEQEKPKFEFKVKRKRRFLGLFEMEVEEKIMVDASTGERREERPWWAFLFG